MRYISSIFFLALSFLLTGQLEAQMVEQIDQYNFEGTENIQVKKLSTSAESSSFLIQVLENVKPHYHREHTETIYVLSGKAIMKIADKEYAISTGTFMEIPPNTVHSVLVSSEEPLVVLSVQAPEFLGKDRFFPEEK